MKSIVKYIFEELKNRQQLIDYLKNITDEEKINKIIKKVNTLNTKEKFDKTNNNFLYDYIKSKVANINTVDNIFHYICKYNSYDNTLLDSFIKPINDYHMANRTRKNAKFNIYDNDNFINYINSESLSNDKNIKTHIFDIQPDKYDSNKIIVHNIFKDLELDGRDEELLKKLAGVKSSGIGDFEILFKIFFYNITNIKSEDKNTSNESGDVKIIYKKLNNIFAEFKCGNFAIKSNGAKNKNAYKEFLEISKMKEWTSFIDNLKKSLGEKFSTVQNAETFKLSNNIFNDILKNKSEKEVSFLKKLYKNGYNIMFNSRLEFDKQNNIDFFELANINIENLIKNNTEEINKFGKLMIMCDLANLVHQHKYLMIFDNKNNGNYIFINFSNYKIDKLYNFISENNENFTFNISPWWGISSREQGLVSHLQLKIKKQNN